MSDDPEDAVDLAHELVITGSDAKQTRAVCTCHHWHREAGTEDLALEGVAREEVLRRAHREHVMTVQARA